MTDPLHSLSDEGFARWDLPAVNGPPVQLQSRKQQGKTVAELEEVENRAYEEAYAKGHAEGLAAAKVEMQKQIDQLNAQAVRFEQVIAALAEPLKDVDAQVEQQLLSLSMLIGTQLARRELMIDPAQVIAVVRETVALLPASARDVRVHLHPDDAAVVRERLAAPGGDRAWTIVEDPVMTRGGCRVSTDSANIDARLETRINTVISTLLGDQRARGGEQ
jgi:flagellar assembly protein FliH